MARKNPGQEREKTMHKSNLASAVASSKNKKTGAIAITYASQESCPSDCAFMGNGCYAENGRMALHTRKLNNAVGDHIMVANAEAEEIDNLKSWAPLRLHAVGDCKDDLSASIVSQAAKRYTKRRNQPVWTYTHSWRDVNVKSWSDVIVRASCETVGDIKQAKKQGYRAAIVVMEFESDKAYKIEDETVIPCVEQTKDISCEDCGLCFNKDFTGTIAFATHSQQVKKANLALENVKKTN